MSKFIGRRLGVGVGIEATRGEGVAPTNWLNAISFSLFDKATKARSQASTGGIWVGDQSLVARKYAEGEIECELDDTTFPIILTAVFGTEASSAVYSGAYKHTFTLTNSSEHKSLSISTSDPNGDYIFEMSMVDSLSMTFSPEELVTYTVGFKAKNSATSGYSPSYATNYKFLGRHLVAKVGDTTADLTAATRLTLMSATLNINKNTDFYNVVGSVQPEDINNKMFTVDGEMEIAFDDMTYRDYMLNGDYKAVRLDLVNTDTTIGTTNPAFRIDLSKVDFDSWDVDYALDDIVKQTITFTALYDLGGNDNVVNDCYVVNETASY